MEKRGRNRRQEVDRWMPLKARQQAETVSSVSRRSPQTPHGKEGVDGSSPSEGFAKALDTAPFLCSPLPNEAASRPFWKADGKSDTPGTIEA
jgi:hypothetical protein